jgi:hypothetical protein
MGQPTVVQEVSWLSFRAEPLLQSWAIPHDVLLNSLQIRQVFLPAHHHFAVSTISLSAPFHQRSTLIFCSYQKERIATSVKQNFHCLVSERLYIHQSPWQCSRQLTLLLQSDCNRPTAGQCNGLWLGYGMEARSSTPATGSDSSVFHNSRPLWGPTSLMFSTQHIFPPE